MEGIVNIEKSKEDVERCKAIVLEEVKEEGLTQTQLEILTKEIMDTSISIGGDFSDDTIQQLTVQYLKTGGIRRFKNAHRGE